MNSLKWLKGLKSLRLGALSGTNGPSAVVGGHCKTDGSVADPLILSRDASTSAAAVKRPPKRPLTPYIRFSLEQRATVVKDNPEMKASQIVSLLGKKWKELPEDEKDRFVKQFQAEIPKYVKLVEEFKSTLKDTDIEDMLREKLTKKLDKEKREKRALTKEMGKPLKPTTPFLRFLMERAQKGMDPKVYAARSKEIAETWHSLPAETKKPYEEAYAADKAKYVKELDKWEEKMLKLGHHDLVRAATSRKAAMQKTENVEKVSKGR